MSGAGTVSGRAVAPAAAVIGRPSNAAKRRREVLIKAADVFSRRGYRVATMNEIAAAVGLSKPTLYHYFSSKEEILVRLYEDVMEQSVAQAREVVAENREPAGAVRALLVQRVVATCGNQAIYKVFFEEEEELPPELLVTLVASRRRYEEIVKASVRSLIEVSAREMQADVTIFVNTCLGAANWVYKWYDPAGPLTPEQIGNQIADHVLARFADA